MLLELKFYDTSKSEPVQVKPQYSIHIQKASEDNPTLFSITDIPDIQTAVELINTWLENTCQQHNSTSKCKDRWYANTIMPHSKTLTGGIFAIAGDDAIYMITGYIAPSTPNTGTLTTETGV